MGRPAKGQPSLRGALDDFITKLKRRQVLGDNSLGLARHTTEVLIHAVAAQQAPTVEGIIAGVRAVGKKLVDARPLGALLRHNPCVGPCAILFLHPSLRAARGNTFITERKPYFAAGTRSIPARRGARLAHDPQPPPHEAGTPRPPLAWRAPRYPASKSARPPARLYRPVVRYQ